MHLRLLQFSDVHLDSSAAGSILGLARAQRAQRALDARKAVGRAIALARSEAVDLVLIPGDLWDDEAVSSDSVAFLGEAFAAIAPIPVFIAPGNHDFCAPGTGYDPTFLTSRGAAAWPDNVHVFRDTRFETVAVPGLDGVTVTGRAFRADVATTERLLAGRINRPRAELGLLLFHGSRIGSEGGKRVITAPFSDAELLGQGFAYSALGHYHERSLIEDARGRLRSAYAGSLVGRTLSEEGPRGALLLEVDAGGVVPQTLRLVETDERRIVRVAVDVTGATGADAARARVRSAVEASGARPEDIVVVLARGRYPRAMAPPAEPPFPDGAFFAIRVVWALEPDYDVAALARGGASVEARFARVLAERIARATTAEERSLLRSALHIGLDAATQGQVHAREIWLGEGADA